MVLHISLLRCTDQHDSNTRFYNRQSVRIVIPGMRIAGADVTMMRKSRLYLGRFVQSKLDRKVHDPS